MNDHVSIGVGQWRGLLPDADLTGMQVFGRVYRLAHLADRRRNALLESYGLQTGDVDVLATLYRYGEGLRPRELRQAMMIGSGTLTARLDRLEVAGLLERHPEPDDRRGRIVRLTADGARITPEVIAQLLAMENDLLATVPAGVRERLAGDLSRLLGAIEAER
jgi:DNA-binding MarR family transcriptional regulator